MPPAAGSVGVRAPGVSGPLPPPAPGPLGATVARGAMWTVASAGANKVVTFGGQLALAWLLVPEDFGLVAMAQSIAAVTSVLSSSNLGNVLIRSRERFREDAREVFWLSLAMGLAAGVLLAALAPLGAAVFGEPRVVPLLLVVAAACPVQALAVVPSAALYQALRYRAISLTNLGTGIVYTGSAVALAAAGLGPMALVLPILARSVFAAAVFRALTGPIHPGKPSPRYWPVLLMPAALLLGTSTIEALRTHGVALVVGATHGAAVTGIFTWGFAMATQLVFLVATNLRGVLFPALTLMNEEPERQGHAYSRACRTLILATGFVCLLQFLLAPWFVQTLFAERWHGAIPVVRIASLALVLQPLGVLSSALLLARGRYGALALLTAATCSMVFIGALVGAASQDIGGIALPISVSLGLSNLFAGGVGLALAKRNWQTAGTELGGVLVPFAGGLIAGLVFEGLVGNTGSVAWSAACAAVGILSFAGLVLVACPQDLLPIQESFRRRPTPQRRACLREDLLA